MLDAIASLVSAGVNAWQGSANRDSQEKMAAQNIALQREFAQNGVSWKVEDAKRAGIHPLAALGANTTSFSPVSIGSTDFGDMGQDLGRAVKAAIGANSREAEDEKEARKLTLEKGRLENDILKTELVSKVRRSTAGVGPPMPSTIDVPRGALAHLDRSPKRSGGFAVEDDPQKVKEFSGHESRRLNLWGVYPFETNPEVSSGNALENELGEKAGEFLGAGNLPAHLIYDFKKNKVPYIQDSLSGYSRGFWDRYSNWRGRR